MSEVCANQQCGHEQQDHMLGSYCRGGDFCGCQSYVAPSEPSLEEVITAVRVFAPQLPDWLTEQTWRELYARLEAVEVEAKPQEDEEDAHEAEQVRLRAEFTTLIASPEVVEEGLPPLSVAYTEDMKASQAARYDAALRERERQLRAEIAAHAQTKEALTEAVELNRQLCDRWQFPQRYQDEDVHAQHVLLCRVEESIKIAATEGSK